MSIKSQLQSKAAAMATSMADRARTPQEIAAIRQRVVAQIQSGELPPYIGVPLVQDLSTRLSKAQQQQAQAVAGMGIPPAPQGAPIAQQVMAQAQQPAGVEALPTNLPQSYAPGGLVAFAEGGDVERYQEGGSPAGRFLSGVFGGMRERGAEYEEMQRLRNQLISKYGAASALPGLFMTQTDPQRQTAKDIMARIDSMTLPEMRAVLEQGTPPASVTPPATPAVTGPTTGDLARADRAAPTPAAAAAAAPAAPSLPGVRMPQINLATYTPGEAPAATNFQSFVSGLPEEAKKAANEAAEARRKVLEDIDRPGFESREERLAKRETALDKDAAVTRALNLMSLGFGIAGSKERSVAGALGREGREGIQALIQGEAANRAAKDRLEDYRDNIEQQKAAAKKGNFSAADAAGQRAANDMRVYAGLNMQAAQAGSQEATQRFQMSEQAKQFQVGEANKATLGLAGLDLQRQQIAQQAQLGRERLNFLKEQLASQDATRRQMAQSSLAQAQVKAAASFPNSPEYRALMPVLQKLPPLEAERRLAEARRAYIMNNFPAFLGSEGGAGNFPSATELLKTVEGAQ